MWLLSFASISDLIVQKNGPQRKIHTRSNLENKNSNDDNVSHRPDGWWTPWRPRGKGPWISAETAEAISVKGANRFGGESTCKQELLDLGEFLVGGVRRGSRPFVGKIVENDYSNLLKHHLLAVSRVKKVNPGSQFKMLSPVYKYQVDHGFF